MQVQHNRRCTTFLVPYIDGVDCYLTFSHRTFPTPGLVANEYHRLGKPVWDRYISLTSSRSYLFLPHLSITTNHLLSENSFLQNNIIWWELLARIWTVLDSNRSPLLSVLNNAFSVYCIYTVNSVERQRTRLNHQHFKFNPSFNGALISLPYLYMEGAKRRRRLFKAWRGSLVGLNWRELLATWWKTGGRAGVLKDPVKALVDHTLAHGAIHIVSISFSDCFGPCL